MPLSDIRRRLNGGQGGEGRKPLNLSTHTVTPNYGEKPSVRVEPPKRDSEEEIMQSLRQLQSEKSRINQRQYEQEQKTQKDIKRLSSKGPTGGYEPTLQELAAERERMTVQSAPKFLRPVIQGLEDLGDIPILRGIGQAAIPEEVRDEVMRKQAMVPVTGAAKTAGEIIAPFAIAGPTGAFSGISEGVGAGLSRYAPGLARTALGRTAQTAIKGGAEGALQDFGGTLATSGGDINQALQAGAFGAVGGGALGGLGRGAVEGFRAGRKALNRSAEDALGELSPTFAEGLTAAEREAVEQAQKASSKKPRSRKAATPTPEPEPVPQPEATPAPVAPPATQPVTGRLAKIRRAIAQQAPQEPDNATYHVLDQQGHPMTREPLTRQEAEELQRHLAENYNFKPTLQKVEPPKAAPEPVHVEPWTGQVWGKDAGRSSELKFYLDNFTETNGRRPTIQESVEEAKYALSTYADAEHGNFEDIKGRNGSGPRSRAQTNVKNLKAFIEKYKDAAPEEIPQAVEQEVAATLQAAPSRTLTPDMIQRARNAGRNPLARKSPVEAPQPEAVVQPSGAANEAVQGAEKPTIASIRERAQGQSRFASKTAQEAEAVGDEVKQALKDSENLSYTKGNNAEQVERANDVIKRDGVDKVITDLIAKAEDKAFTGDDTALAIRAIQEAQRTDIEKAVTMAEILSQRLTKAGQEIQAASIMKRLSPEGQLVHATRVAKAAGKELTPAEGKAIVEAAEIAQKGEASKGATVSFLDALDEVKARGSITDEELKSIEELLEQAGKRTKPQAEAKPAKPRTRREKINETADKWIEEAKAAWKAKQNVGFAQRIDDPDIAIAVKLATGYLLKGSVKLADLTETLARDLGEVVRPHAQEIYERARRAAGGTAKHIGAGKLKEAQEAFERLSAKRSPADKAAERFMQGKNIKPGDIEKVRELAKSLNELQGMDATNAQMTIQKILQKYSKSSLWDKAQTMRYIAMLLNDTTQTVNALSGPIMASTGYVADVFGTMFDMAFSKLAKEPRTTTLYGSNPLRFIADWFKNARVGGKAGAQGLNPGGITSQSDFHGLAFPELSVKKPIRTTLGLLERGLGAVAKGADYATYKTVYDSELKKIAFLDAKNKGIKGKDAIKSHVEKFVIDPPQEAIDRADKMGRRTTFQRKDSTGAYLANKVNSIGSEPDSPGFAKAAKYGTQAIFPFIRTPLNIASEAFNLTPGGTVKGIVKMVMAKNDAEARDALRTLSISAVGGGLTALGYYLSQLGIITGANDSGNKHVDKMQEQAGKGKYLFNRSGLQRYLSAVLNGEGGKAAEQAAKYREGDKQFDYNKLQPLAFPAAIGASLQENKGESAGKKLENTASDAYGSFYNMSMLKGMQDLFATPMQGTLGEKALAVPTSIVESFAKSFSPSMLAQFARTSDNTQRQTPFKQGIVPDVRGYFASRTPGQTGNLPPMVTTYGETKKYGRAFGNPYKDQEATISKAAMIASDLYERTKNEDLAAKPPEKTVTIKGESIPIPTKRYIQMQQEQGAEISKRILALDKNMSDSDKVDAILQIYDDVRKEQREKVKAELGGVSGGVR